MCNRVNTHNGKLNRIILRVFSGYCKGSHNPRVQAFSSWIRELMGYYDVCSDNDKKRRGLLLS